MKKYKLIKNFPTNDLPEGTIVTQYELGQYVSENITIFKKEDIENFSDFWEEIIEEDYAIIGFNDGFNDYFKVLNGKFTINSTSYYDEDDLLSKKYKITAIMRLSDNKKFRIGDKIIWEWVHSMKDFYEIENFTIQSNKKLYINNMYRFEVIGKTLNHRIEPVMVTEDGVEIFKNDPYWLFWTYNPSRGRSINKPYIVNHASGDGDGWCENAKFFSTKEKANEYILKHTPIYTTEDNVKVFPGDIVYYVLSNYAIKFYKPEKDDRSQSIHYFSSLDLAQEYVDENSPLFSSINLKDAYNKALDDIQTDIHRFKRFEGEDGYLCICIDRINELKK